METFGNSFIVMPPAIIAGALVAGIFGLIVGLPSLRLKGDYLAIVTLGFAEIFRYVITTSPRRRQGGPRFWISKLGGPQGYSGPDNFGVAQYAGPFWVFGGVITATIIAWRLKFSGWGRALRALREDEIAAAAVGVDPTRYKVTSFVISAMGAGVAGALLASMRDGNPSIQPEQFGFALSFDAITMVILGGSGSVSGAVLGGLFVTITVKMIEQLQRLDAVEAFKKDHPDFDLNALRMVVYAIVLILLMVVRPAGVFGENEITRYRRRKEDPTPACARPQVHPDRPRRVMSAPMMCKPRFRLEKAPCERPQSRADAVQAKERTVISDEVAEHWPHLSKPAATQGSASDTPVTRRLRASQGGCCRNSLRSGLRSHPKRRRGPQLCWGGCRATSGSKPILRGEAIAEETAIERDSIRARIAVAHLQLASRAAGLALATQRFSARRGRSPTLFGVRAARCAAARRAGARDERPQDRPPLEALRRPQGGERRLVPKSPSAASSASSGRTAPARRRSSTS